MYVLLGNPYISFFVSVGVLVSFALHLPEMHDGTRKHITICNDDYKFVAYPQNIRHEFAVKNMVKVTTL